jgi:molecular chaperone GrpE
VTAPDRDERIVDDPDRVVVRDKRRLDPESGALREPAPVVEAAPAVDEAVAEVEQPDRVAELTADLQRLSAEYANYRKRVERDRVAVVEMATAGLLAGLLPVLDDVDRARQHGDLTGGFQAVGEALEALTAKLGLERFGEAGEAFDPSVHEALMQAEPDPTATVAVCAAVFSPGYRMAGGRVLRPARVSVAEPGAVADPVPASE